MIALKKLMVFILVFAILIVVREIGAFTKAFIRSEQIDMSLSRQIVLASAISYIMTIIFTGFSLF